MVRRFGGRGSCITRGNAVSFGWVKEDLSGGFPLIDIFTGGSSSAGVAAIDAKHAAVVWADSSVKGTIMTCGQ